jgi:superfamily II DNA or RNA helicase
LATKKKKPLYLPETDSGEALSGAHRSAWMWVPSEEIPNKKALINASKVISVNERTGETNTFSLARDLGDYVVIARHFFTEEEWKEKIGKWGELRLEDSLEKFDFGDKIKPRDADQQKAWDAFKDQQFGVLNLACGKGKTVMALKKIAKRGYPAVVIVNNSGLMDQWKDRALEFLGIGEDDIGIVQGSKEEWDKPLVLAMIHTLAKRAHTIPHDVRSRFGTVIFDEVHHLSAATFSQTAPLFYGNRYGLTATPNREDGLEDVYYAHIGPIFYSDLVGDLEAQIYFKKVKTTVPKDDSRIKDITGEFSAGKMYTYFSELGSRNREILAVVQDALGKGRKILVLTHSKDHPKVLLQKLLDTECMNRYTAGAVTGDTSGDMRTQVIRDSDVTFATFGVAREGLDVAALDTLVFATPFKAWGAFQQGKGRIERKSPGKKEPIVVVIDDYKFGPAGAMCRNLRRKIVANGFRHKSIGRED